MNTQVVITYLPAAVGHANGATCMKKIITCTELYEVRPEPDNRFKHYQLRGMW
jgi:hypothetical protein